MYTIYYIINIINNITWYIYMYTLYYIINIFNIFNSIYIIYTIIFIYILTKNIRIYIGTYTVYKLSSCHVSSAIYIYYIYSNGKPWFIGTTIEKLKTPILGGRTTVVMLAFWWFETPLRAHIFYWVNLYTRIYQIWDFATGCETFTHLQQICKYVTCRIY